MNRIEYEKRVIKKMITLYCRKKHGAQELCSACMELSEYAMSRLQKCRYRKNKPLCNACSIHCYSSNKREQIKNVMRFSGPRIIFIDPILAIKHLLGMARAKLKDKE